MLEWHRNEVEERLARPQVQRFRVNASSITPVRRRNNLRPQSQPAEPQGPPPASTPTAHNHTVPPPTVAPPPPTSSTSFLPVLPPGVVTEEIVASLDRYPMYEQQAWANALPPPTMQVYRQMVAKRSNGTTHGPPSTAALADLPSTGRPNGPPTYPDRQAPPMPTIKCIDFAFSAAGDDPNFRQAVRLHNMRGVVTHAVVLGAETSEIELTAYIADASPGEVVSPAVAVPEVSLRLNGNQGSLPKFVFQGDVKDRPAGMRWTVNVPTTRVETKIEVVATKPGALAETSSIFINRQY